MKMAPRKKKAVSETATVTAAQPAQASVQAAPEAESAPAAAPASESQSETAPGQITSQTEDQTTEESSGDNSSAEEPTTGEPSAEDPSTEEPTEPTPEEPVPTEPTPEGPADRQSIAAVMNLCATMITGGYDEDYLREILDALRAQQQITDLQIKVADLENTIGQMKTDFAAQLEQAVAEAHAQGEIDGRNAHIEETLQSPVVIPHLVGSQTPRRAASIFDLAATAK